MRYSVLVAALSLVMIFLVVAGQVVQYHHHDECDEICLCLNPSSHCHDDDHDDCNHHQDSKDCSLHFEDSIVVDANDHDLIISAVFVLAHDAFSMAADSDVSDVLWPERTLLRYTSGFTVCRQLRAPPVG